MEIHSGPEDKVVPSVVIALVVHWNKFNKLNMHLAKQQSWLRAAAQCCENSVYKFYLQHEWSYISFFVLRDLHHELSRINLFPFTKLFLYEVFICKAWIFYTGLLKTME